MQLKTDTNTAVNATALRELCAAKFTFSRTWGKKQKFGEHYNRMKELNTDFKLKELNEDNSLFYYLDEIGIVTFDSQASETGSVISTEKDIHIHPDKLTADQTGQLLLLILFCRIVELTHHGELSSLAIKVATESLPLLIKICVRQNVLSGKNVFLVKTLREFDFYLMDILDPTPQNPVTKLSLPPCANVQELQMVVKCLIDIAHSPVWLTASGLEGFFKRLLSDEPELITSIKRVTLLQPNPTIEQISACVEKFEMSNRNYPLPALKDYGNLVINIRDLIHSETSYNDLAYFVNDFLTQQKIRVIRKLTIKPEQTLTSSKPIDIPKPNAKR